MKRFFVSCVLAGFVAAGTACAADPELKTDDEKTLYALGLVLANQLGPFKLTPAELEIVKAGLTDGDAQEAREGRARGLRPQDQAARRRPPGRGRRGREEEGEGVPRDHRGEAGDQEDRLGPADGDDHRRHRARAWSPTDRSR